MDDGQRPSCNPRVIVLSHDPSLATVGQGASMEFISTPSAYEAAAEILAAPAIALVVDLRLLSNRHLRLLSVARDMELEMFAVGTVPAGMTAEKLSGVRMVSRSDLASALTVSARRDQTPRPHAPVRLTAAKPPEAPDMDVIEDDFVLDVHEPLSTPESNEPQPPAPAETFDESSGSFVSEKPPILAPDTLLTPEEIAALLGNES